MNKAHSRKSWIHFYKFPQAEHKRELWLSALNRKDYNPSPNMYLCKVHFAGGKKNDACIMASPRIRGLDACVCYALHNGHNKQSVTIFFELKGV